MCAGCGVGAAIVEMLFTLVMTIVTLSGIVILSIIDWLFSKLSKQSH